MNTTSKAKEAPTPLHLWMNNRQFILIKRLKALLVVILPLSPLFKVDILVFDYESNKERKKNRHFFLTTNFVAFLLLSRE
jgi:hypothetical protein